MAIKHVFTTNTGSILVCTLVEELTEVINTTVLSPVIPPQGAVPFNGEWTTNTVDFTDTDPGIGIIKFNADPVVPANITMIFIDNWDDQGVYQRDDLRKFRAGDPIIIVDTPAKAMSFLVTGMPDISETGYVKIPVSFEQGMGTVGNASAVDVTGVIDSDGGQVTPAITEDVEVVTAYLVADVWLARTGVEVYKVLNTMDAPNVSTTWAEFWAYIPYDMTILRADVSTITVVDNASTNWDPPSEQ